MRFVLVSGDLVGAVTGNRFNDLCETDTAGTLTLRYRVIKRHQE